MYGLSPIKIQFHTQDDETKIQKDFYFNPYLLEYINSAGKVKKKKKESKKKEKEKRKTFPNDQLGREV